MGDSSKSVPLEENILIFKHAIPGKQIQWLFLTVPLPSTDRIQKMSSYHQDQKIKIKIMIN